MVLSTGNEIRSLLLEKNPELFFLLEYGEKNQKESEELCTEEEARKRVQQLALSELSTLYVYGISPFYYQLLVPWLSEKKERRLIFLIHDLSLLHSVLESEDCIRDPQVVLFHFVDKDSSIQELVSRFPCNLVEVISATAGEDPSIEDLRLELFRKSSLAHAIFAETLHAPKLQNNILANISLWDRSFLANTWKQKFAGVPAIICGAGPSLQKEIPRLSALKDQALLLAGGSTITALSRQGITPHLCLAIDPNPEEFERLKEASCLCEPLLYGTRLEKDVLPCFGGELGYISSDTGGPVERYFEEVLGIHEEPIGPELGMEALSVTTLALAFAVHIGCDPILFCGVDLAYTQGKRYASEVLASATAPNQDCDMRSAERFVTREDIYAQPVQTLVKWVMESECIGEFAKKMAPVRFINVSQGGIGFPHIENRLLEEVMRKELLVSYDLKARVHAEIQESLCAISQKEIGFEKENMRASLERLSLFIDKIVVEIETIQTHGREFPSAKFLFLEMEAKEEIGLSRFNPYIEAVLDRLMERWFLPGDCTIELSRALAKYKALKNLISAQLGLLTAP